METDTGMGRKPREDEGRDWQKSLCMEQHPRRPANHQKLGERHGEDDPSRPFEGTDPAEHPDLERLASRTVRQHISVF